MAQAFDPVLIILQIVCLQCLHYLVLGLELLIFRVLFATPLSLDTLFDEDKLAVGSAPGWGCIALHITTAIASALLLVIVVEKAKKCLDFAFTLYLAHLVACMVYGGAFPSSWEFWVVNGMCLAIMTTLGEFLCSRQELQDIPLWSVVPTVQSSSS